MRIADDCVYRAKVMRRDRLVMVLGAVAGDRSAGRWDPDRDLAVLTLKDYYKPERGNRDA